MTVREKRILWAVLFDLMDKEIKPIDPGPGVPG